MREMKSFIVLYNGKFIRVYREAAADKVIDNLEAAVRRLKRMLWLARTEWARSSALSYHLIECHPNKDAAATYKRKANKWERLKTSASRRRRNTNDKVTKNH